MDQFFSEWPKKPYKGLAYYREVDAPLFGEREQHVRDCADLLLSYGVKIIVLQGSSGAGKSSFLRAGLIPYLKSNSGMGSDDRKHCYFFNCGDSVIRCTSNPMLEIAGTILRAVGEETPLLGGTASDVGIDEKKRQVITNLLNDAQIIGPAALVDRIVEALIKIAADLPGKLVLVLDQAEEVLTRTTGQLEGNQSSAAFFGFLEKIYLRNADLRILIAMRTEYYGRFRDELKIADNRLSDRPRSGGIAPYLLRPVRERDALIRVILAPTRAVGINGKSVYNFGFDPNVVETIVADLLGEFPHASVMPALQVVCSSLHECRRNGNRKISLREYTEKGGVRGILRAYFQHGLECTGAISGAQTDKWYQVLHSLVSRQGGGTIVSLNETLEDLVLKAKVNGITGDIPRILRKLTQDPAPLLRGEPPDRPRTFSLKHDMLAVALSRWHDERQGALKVQTEEAGKRKLIIYAAAFMVALLTAIAAVVAYVAYDRAVASLKSKNKATNLTNAFAARSPAGDFRLSLLLLISNLDATTKPPLLVERLAGGNGDIERSTIEQLRQVMLRVPWFSGSYRAVGLDPGANRVALLGDRKLQVLHFPNGPEIQSNPNFGDEGFNFVKPQATGFISSSTGFVSALGPVAVHRGVLFFKNAAGAVVERDLSGSLPERLKVGFPPRFDIVSGQLQGTRLAFENQKTSMRIIRLDAADIAKNTIAIPDEDPPLLTERPVTGFPPVLSDIPKTDQMYGFLGESKIASFTAGLPIEPDAVLSFAGRGRAQRDEGGLSQLDLVIGDVASKLGRNEVRERRIPVAIVHSEPGLPDRRRSTFAFAANQGAGIFKFDGPSFYIFDLAKIWSNPNDLRVQRYNVRQVDSNLQVLPASLGMLPPLLAAAETKSAWRAAWLASNGVWVVETRDGTNDAYPIVGGPLLSGGGGTKLQFTSDGEFLILQQQRQFTGPVQVRIWDLRQSWRDWILNSDVETLRAEACRVVKSDESGGKFTEAEAQLFEIADDRRQPCA
ncbi:hypothetical protein FHX06_005696 [Rhizobium sp. BK512]|uniref:nSTAND1 domain-containing NTPase n=1 Tax=Rhizobium sp. BK512 TaxID=2587010 RepID=UPI00161CAA9B|nr:hypothetical protein [Rhizobium sp. BK512]MBB3564332.1 hypothetical protein [Rhizobium sp. BK512]